VADAATNIAPAHNAMARGRRFQLLKVVFTVSLEGWLPKFGHNGPLISATRRRGLPRVVARR
jgi:hypothetical protein